MVRVGAESEIGRQEVPASWLSHTPPFPTPTSQCVESLGSTAIEATRPELKFGM